MKKLKIAWIHNFSTDINNASGIFMYQLYDNLKTESSVEVELINIGNILNPFTFLIKYFKYRNNLKSFDLLHAQYGSGTGFFVSLFSQRKILSIRGSDWYESPANAIFSKLHIKLGNLLTQWSVNSFNKIIVMSERMKHEVAEKFSDAHIEVIPDGINLDRFKPLEKKTLGKYRILFSSVSEDNPVKRYKLAKDAFDIFQRKYPDSELVFMSGIPHGQVNLFINSCHLILLTSTHEGWPNIIKEGLACNVPFVSTDVSDLKEVANKSNSCFICEANESDLANCIEKAYCMRTENENLRDISKEFDITQITKKLLSLYNEFT